MHGLRRKEKWKKEKETEIPEKQSSTKKPGDGHLAADSRRPGMALRRYISIITENVSRDSDLGDVSLEAERQAWENTWSMTGEIPLGRRSSPG